MFSKERGHLRDRTGRGEDPLARQLAFSCPPSSSSSRFLALFLRPPHLPVRPANNLLHLPPLSSPFSPHFPLRGLCGPPLASSAHKCSDFLDLQHHKPLRKMSAPKTGLRTLSVAFLVSPGVVANPFPACRPRLHRPRVRPPLHTFLSSLLTSYRSLQLRSRDYSGSHLCSLPFFPLVPAIPPFFCSLSPPSCSPYTIDH